MDKFKKILRYFAVIISIVYLMLSGLFCATTPPRNPTVSDFADPSKMLQITVVSVPTGADVYGISGNTPGTYFGKTTFTFKYRLWNKAIWGIPSADETIGYDYSRDKVTDTDYIIFKCLVYKDGYEPYQISEVLEKSSNISIIPSKWVNLDDFNILKGGVRKKFTAFLTPTYKEKQEVERPQQQPPQQQQQQQQQSIIIPESKDLMGKIVISCNVQDAELYVDGVFTGNTPATLNLKDGIHIIEVKKSGYKDYRKELRVIGGSELSLRVTIEKK